jgi:hypothetical protein
MEKILKLENCDKNAFLSLVKQMVVVDKYMNIRVNTEYTDSSSYTSQKDVVKYIKTENASLFESAYELDKPVRMCFINGTKIMLYLNQFTLDKVDIEIHYEEYDDELYATRVTFLGGDLKMTEVCADRQYDGINISPIKDEIMQKLLDTENTTVSVDIPKDAIKSMKALCGIEKNTAWFEYVIADNKISVRERTDLEEEDSVFFNKVIADTDYDGEPLTVLCKKNVFDAMSILLDYNVCICNDDGKVVYKHEEKDSETYIIAAI